MILVNKLMFNCTEKFSGVAAKHPQDKSTGAYVLLLKSLLHGGIEPVDTVKDIVAGFEFEADVWALQGWLRQATNADHAAGE